MSKSAWLILASDSKAYLISSNIGFPKTVSSTSNSKRHIYLCLTLGPTKTQGVAVAQCTDKGTHGWLTHDTADTM